MQQLRREAAQKLSFRGWSPGKVGGSWARSVRPISRLILAFVNYAQLPEYALGLKEVPQRVKSIFRALSHFECLRWETAAAARPLSIQKSVFLPYG